MHNFNTFPASRLSEKSLVIINGKFRKKTELCKIVNLSNMQTGRQSTCEQNSQWGIHQTGFCLGCFRGCVVYFISLPSAISVTERTGGTFGLLLLFSKCSSSLHGGGGGGQWCHYNRYNHTHGRHQLFAMGM